MITFRIDIELLARFESKFEPEPNSGCWLWTASAFPDGYGQIKTSGKNMRAHRLSWILYRGEIPNGLQVLHRCDTPLCINPDHLFLGTSQDNVDDMMQKGRHRPPRGVALSSAKLTESAVRAIRADQRNHGRIAKDYGVNRSLISLVKAGSIWGHVT